MKDRTRDLWELQDKHSGDRHRLFTAVADVVVADRVLYPGSFVDVSPSFVYPSVTYVDVDARAARFFADEDGVRELIAEHSGQPTPPDVEFIAGDYTEELGLEDDSYDLLISLYAGFISEHCTQYLRPGGSLLVNPSHGDAALASIDDRYRLNGVITTRAGTYLIHTDGLDAYMRPASGKEPTREHIVETQRGVRYTKPAFAYLFEKVG